ncbi:hypothetical protein NDI47_00055 [Microcoleus vaginatus GB1-A2]|nr:hypothetical protein [Microcoleus sp. FACHB-61]
MNWTRRCSISSTTSNNLKSLGGLPSELISIVTVGGVELSLPDIACMA